VLFRSRIERCHQPAAGRVALEEIRARCQSRYFTFDESHRTHQEQYFEFGPRWRCLKSIHIGTNEALASLELPTAFLADTSEYHLHPALLDLATGAALYLIADYGPTSSVYFPIYYKSAIVFRTIPARFFSHIRSLQTNDADRGVATFDLSLVDPEGNVLAEIGGFSMRQVRDPRDVLGIVGPHVSASVARNKFVEHAPQRGIVSEQGAKAFTRIISSQRSSEVFVLPGGPDGVIRHPEIARRPDPRNGSFNDDVETVLAGWWHELMGMDQIGLDDDFFELGGHSLLVVRLVSKMKKTYSANISLSTFFEARTIRTLARRIREGRAKTNDQPSSGRAVVPIRAVGTRPPLYVVSGLDGHVLGFHKMALHLSEDQPLYGLVPRGVDGPEPYHASVEEMASYYVRAIRTHQPEGPYRLVGHSFGGIVAFEVAQQIMSEGGVVDFLGMFDTIERRYMEEVRKSLRIRDRVALFGSELRFALLERDPFGPVRRRLNRMTSKAISLIFPNVSAPQSQGRGTIKDVNLCAFSIYQPTAYPGRLTLFRSTTREIQDGNDEFLGWGKLVKGGTEVHGVPSTHYNMIDEPAVGILAEILQECLDRARGSVNPL
jgi:thioesterase domain-containing protein/acyl carrier protein